MADSPPSSAARRFAFPRSHRLAHAREFAAVYNARCRKNQGPLVVHGRPNGLGHSRLGLSVSKRVGSAVVRNRVKRLVREAFRRMGGDFPTGYDLVVAVRPHETPLTLAECQHLLHKAWRQVHQEWNRRTQPSRPPPTAPSPPDADRPPTRTTGEAPA